MSKSAKSVFVFGFYLTVIGLILLLVPNMLLDIISIEPTSEVWIRLAGILLMAISVYYYIGAKNEIVVILKTTAYIRFTIIFFFTAFVLFKLISPVIILFAVVDLIGGLWTFILLKKEGHFGIK